MSYVTSKYAGTTVVLFFDALDGAKSSLNLVNSVRTVIANRNDNIARFYNTKNMCKSSTYVFVVDSCLPSITMII